MWILAGLMALAVSCSGESNTQITEYKLNADSNDCGSTLRIPAESEYRINSQGDTPVPNCKFDFTSDTPSDCEIKGLCYQFNPSARFRSSKVRLIASSGGVDTVIANSTIQPRLERVCVENTNMVFNLQKDSDYEFKEGDNAEYNFILDVYNRCGPRGTARGLTFDEAIQNLDGYHHGEEREARERNNYIGGILLGFGLASVFLIVLLCGYCYVRNSPNRGPNRSVGMPKVGGFKKNMKPNKETAGATEMGVRYTVTGDSKPEGKPLLTSSDPEKPPAEMHVAEEGK